MLLPEVMAEVELGDGTKWGKVGKAAKKVGKFVKKGVKKIGQWVGLVDAKCL